MWVTRAATASAIRQPPENAGSGVGSAQERVFRDGARKRMMLSCWRELGSGVLIHEKPVCVPGKPVLRGRRILRPGERSADPGGTSVPSVAYYNDQADRQSLARCGCHAVVYLNSLQHMGQEPE